MSMENPWAIVAQHTEIAKTDFAHLLPLFEMCFGVPRTSAPVERIFSHGAVCETPPSLPQ